MDHTPPPSRDDPRETWRAWAQAEFPTATEVALEAALTVVDAGGEADVAAAAAHRAALLHSVSASLPPPPAPLLSPDGRHTWDGVAWREVRVTPATATADDLPPAPSSPPPLGPPPAWPAAAPPPPPHAGRIAGVALGATAVLAAAAVAAISLVVHHTNAGGSAGGSGPSATFAPGSTHCTFRVSEDSLSLIVDASDPPVDCGTVQAAFEAAERTAGASVTPIVGLPGGASATCSHQFGTSGYTMTIYSDPTSSDEGGGRQAFVQAACGAFMHLAGGG
ncbi:MAG TPA: hypothetical protein VF112_05675 [Candidatus Dormibacteraeota bacterium]